MCLHALYDFFSKSAKDSLDVFINFFKNSYFELFKAFDLTIIRPIVPMQSSEEVSYLSSIPIWI